MVSLRMSRSWSISTWISAAAVSVVFILATPGLVRADDDPVAAEAKKHYEEGTKAFNLGEYPRAIAEFKATYNAKPDPLLLYNIAQSYRLAEDAAQALFFYKSFLRNMPAATNRKEVEGRIKELEKKVADQKKDPGLAPPPVVVPVLPLGTTAPVTTPGPASAPLSSSGPSLPTNSGPTGSAPVPVPVPPGAPAPKSGTASTEPGVDLTAPAPPEPAEKASPFYKKWWFWAAAGVLIIITGTSVANARKPPDTALGTFDPKWTP